MAKEKKIVYTARQQSFFNDLSPMKKLFIFALFLFSVSPLQSHANPVSYNDINNRYELALTPDDRGSIYLSKDHTFMFIPALVNSEYVHNCWGKWYFSEPRQTLRFREADKCRVLKGVYTVSKQGKILTLKNRVQEFKLKPFSKIAFEADKKKRRHDSH